MSGFRKLAHLKLFALLLAAVAAWLGSCQAGPWYVPADKFTPPPPPPPTPVWNWSAFWNPYGIVAVASLVAFVVLMLITYEPRGVTGRCYRCGYDLTGNVSGRCPECGEHVGRPLV